MTFDEWKSTLRGAAAGATLGPVGVVVGGLAGNSAADAAERNRQTSENAANEKSKWDADRNAVDAEWSALRSQYGNFESPVINGMPDYFEQMSHRQIFDAVNAVKEGSINEQANGWRNTSTRLNAMFDEFNKGIEKDISEHWNGKSGAAAVNATKEYTGDSKTLAVGAQMLAHGLDRMESFLGQAKATIPQPEDLGWLDRQLGKIPGSGVLKLAQYQHDEAENRAREYMISNYRPGAQSVGTEVPVLPEPKNPVAQKPPESPGPGGPGPGGPGSGGPGPGGPGPGGPGPGGPGPGGPGTSDPYNPGSDPRTDYGPGDIPGETNPASTTPAFASPQVAMPDAASTTPAGLSTPATIRNTEPGAHLPKSWMEDPFARDQSKRGPGTSSGPGATGSSLSAPSLGQGGAGNRVGPSGAAAAGAAGRAGLPGMGGMMPPGARGNGDDDKEHTSPDYLQNNDFDTYLTAGIPKTAPPVIGG